MTRPAASGLTGGQVLARVEVPNALPLILAGVRSAANQVIATAAILGVKGQGGLGVYIFSGYATQRYDVVAGASIAIVALGARGRGAVRRDPAPSGVARSAHRPGGEQQAPPKGE